MPIASLSTIDARIERAKEQAADLDRLIRPLTGNNSYRIVCDQKGFSTEHPFRFYFKTPIDFVRAGIIYGEFIHNLRSVLDNLCWQLVLLSGGTPTVRTEWPTFTDETDFLKDLKAKKPKLGGIRDDIVAEIEKMQPYKLTPHAPESSAFLHIHKINIEDKHHVVIPLAVAVRHGGMPKLPKGFRIVWEPVLQHGAVIYTLYTPAPVSKVNMRLPFESEIVIQVEQGTVELSSAIGEMGNDVSWLVKHFRKFF